MQKNCKTVGKPKTSVYSPIKSMLNAFNTKFQGTIYFFMVYKLKCVVIVLQMMVIMLKTISNNLVDVMHQRWVYYVNLYDLLDTTFF